MAPITVTRVNDAGRAVDVGGGGVRGSVPSLAVDAHDAHDARGAQATVKTSGPLSVTAMVCSKCAESCPSWVITPQPSSSTYVS